MAMDDHDSGSIAWPPALRRANPSKRAERQALRAREPLAHPNGNTTSMSRPDRLNRQRYDSAPSPVSSVMPESESSWSGPGVGRVTIVEDEVEECMSPEDQVIQEARPPTKDRRPRTLAARDWSPRPADVNPDPDPDPWSSEDGTESRPVDPSNTSTSPVAGDEPASPVRSTVTLRARFRSQDAANRQPGSGHEGFVELDVEHLIDLLQSQGHLEPRASISTLGSGKASRRTSTPYHHHYSSPSSSNPEPSRRKQPAPSPSPASFAPSQSNLSPRHRAAYTPLLTFSSPPPKYTSRSATFHDRNSRSWLLKTEQRPARGGGKIAVKVQQGPMCWMRHREPKGRRMEANSGKRK